MKKLIAMVLAAALMLSPMPTYANEAKPTLRLDLRSQRQAVFIITDPNIGNAKEDIRYDIQVGNYRFRMIWSILDANAGAVPGYGSLLYHESSDNSMARVGNTVYPDGSLATSVLLVEETKLELWIDLERDGLDISSPEGPRDLSDKLRNIDFTTMRDDAKLECNYDYDGDNDKSTHYSYTSEEYRYRNKWGLTYVLQQPLSWGFVSRYDFGRCAGLTSDEVEALYWTPPTDNYLITKQRVEHEFEFLWMHHKGMSDLYEMTWFDADGTILGWREKNIFDDSDGDLAHFQNMDTDPNVNMHYEKCVGIAQKNDSDKRTTFSFVIKDTINKMQAKQVTKDVLIERLTADVEIIANVGGKVG